MQQKPFAEMLAAIRDAYEDVLGPYPFPVHIVVTLVSGNKQEFDIPPTPPQTTADAILEALEGGKQMKRAVLARAVGVGERQAQRVLTELLRDGLVVLDKEDGYSLPQ